MFVTIINDCNDANAFGRQATRASVLFDTQVTTVGVAFGSTLEAAGNLIDVLDASGGNRGVILVNVAPRHGESKKWTNGTPFCYFYYKDTLVVSSVEGLTVSLVKKLGLVSEVRLLDIPTVISYVIQENILEKQVGESIITSQFRSFDFLPRVAKWMWDGVKIPYKNYSLVNIKEAPKAVWLIDNFGNCKTTILPEEIQFKAGKRIKTKVGIITCYEYLKDVPNGKRALIAGSSGLASKRFLELVIQGEDVAKKLHIFVGSEL